MDTVNKFYVKGPFVKMIERQMRKIEERNNRRLMRLLWGKGPNEDVFNGGSESPKGE